MDDYEHFLQLVFFDELKKHGEGNHSYLFAETTFDDFAPFFLEINKAIMNYIKDDNIIGKTPQ